MKANIDTHSSKENVLMHAYRQKTPHTDTCTQEHTRSHCEKISFVQATVQSSLRDLNFLITRIHPDFLPDGERMFFFFFFSSEKGGDKGETEGKQESKLGQNRGELGKREKKVS